MKKEDILKQGFVEVHARVSGIRQLHVLKVRWEKTAWGMVPYLIAEHPIPANELLRLAEELQLPIRCRGLAVFPKGKAAQDFAVKEEEKKPLKKKSLAHDKVVKGEEEPESEDAESGEEESEGGSEEGGEEEGKGSEEGDEESEEGEGGEAVEKEPEKKGDNEEGQADESEETEEENGKEEEPEEEKEEKEGGTESEEETSEEETEPAAEEEKTETGSEEKKDESGLKDGKKKTFSDVLSEGIIR